MLGAPCLSQSAGYPAFRSPQELHGRLAALEQASSELAQLRGKCYAAMHQLRQVRRGGAPGSSEAAADAAATVTEEEALEPGHLPELCRELAAQFQVGLMT